MKFIKYILNNIILLMEKNITYPLPTLSDNIDKDRDKNKNTFN